MAMSLKSDANGRPNQEDGEDEEGSKKKRKGRRKRVRGR